MATSSIYRGGSIWSMVPGSGETLGSGGQLLNHNFTELYDLVRPADSTDTSIVYVPTMNDESSIHRYARAMNVPNPDNASLHYSSEYVPVFRYYGSGTGDISWKPYVSETSGTGSPTATSDSASELYAQAVSAPYWYVGSDSNGSSMWSSYESTVSAYQKTYKSIVFNKTLQVNLPSFGAWLVTGTIVAYRDNNYFWFAGDARLMRIYVTGFDSNVSLSHVEVYDGSNRKWSTAINYPQITIVSGQMKLKLDEHWEVGCMLHDLTVVGGGMPKFIENGSTSFYDFS